MKKSHAKDLPSGFRGLKAIVVDGKPVRAALTRYHLKRLGILVEVASSVKIAVSAYGKSGSSSRYVEFHFRIIIWEKVSEVSEIIFCILGICLMAIICLMI